MTPTTSARNYPRPCCERPPSSTCRSTRSLWTKHRTSGSGWEGLALHANPEHTPLYLFADDNQNIYEGAPLPIQPNEIFGPLRKNMRNSKEIQRVLSALHKGDEASLVNGPEVGPDRVTGGSTACRPARRSRPVPGHMVAPNDQHLEFSRTGGSSRSWGRVASAPTAGPER